ncbi:MAG: hypothetical protein J5916_07375 [Oscillospiraceae bacterium]|nr:hypothetical protein [Clostridia bacterium]MBO5639708.1 hypothetical protein [Oscillospiraceae bacterium]
MSKPREPWWPYVKNVLRMYPQLKRDLEAIRSQSVTTHYNAAGGSSGPGRSTEQAAMRELPPQRMKEYEAVRKAIRDTGHKQDGRLRNDIIRLVYFKKRYSLSGAAWACHVSYGTAKNWQQEFMHQVAYYLGLK